MKIYHTATQEDYDALMIELEAKGYKWSDGEMSTYDSCFGIYGSETAVRAIDTPFRKTMKYADVTYVMECYPNEPIIEYKAKGEDEVTTKCEKCDIEYHDEKANFCSMCGTKLFKQSKFKEGDYVVEQYGHNVFISKIFEIDEVKHMHGKLYNQKSLEISKRYENICVQDARPATPEEIAEYDIAMNFDKHGRKPFEIKKGDLLDGQSGKFFILRTNFKKEDFISGNYKLLKTAEEIEEWLGADDE